MLRIPILVGTYTQKEGHVDGKGKGIYVFEFDPASSDKPLQQIGNATLHNGSINPSYLARLDNGDILAVAESSNSGLDTYAFNQETLSLSSKHHHDLGASGACYIGGPLNDQLTCVANYGSGSVNVVDLAVVPNKTVQVLVLGREDDNTKRVSHAHSTIMSPDGKHLLICDLGRNTVEIYKYHGRDAKSEPFRLHQTYQCDPHAGPRHLVFCPSDATRVLLSTEYSNQLIHLRFDIENGTLHHIQSISTLPDDFKGRAACSELCVVSGQFVYVANRFHDTIAVFVYTETGFELIQHISTEGKTPRHMHLVESSNNGTFLIIANQDSNNLATFKCHPTSGKLTFTHAITHVPSPSFVLPIG